MGPRTKIAACLAVAVTAVGASSLAYGDARRAGGEIQAYDNGFINPADGSTNVTVDPGDTVTFSYPTGASFHNVTFDGDLKPVCTQTAPAASQAGPPPMPAFPSGHGWSGTCRFDTSGVYSFHCQAHPDQMQGTITVTGAGEPATTPSPTSTPSSTATPAATATPTPVPGHTTPAAATPTPTPTLLAGPAAPTIALKLAASQKGRTLKGSVTVTGATSKLTVAVLAKPSTLGAKGRALKPVGSLTKSLAAGTHAFAIKLAASAARAIQSHKKLSLTVRVTVRPATGAPFAATRTVMMRR
jgi:plastocyanin